MSAVLLRSDTGTMPHTGATHVMWWLKAEGLGFLFVSYVTCVTIGGSPETMTFACDPFGKVFDWEELAVSYCDDPDAALFDVLAQLGIEGVTANVP